MQPFQQIRSWCQERPLTAGVGLWATGMAAMGVYQYNRNTRLSLKVIQARMFAQAGIVLGLVVAGAVNALSDDNSRSRPAVDARTQFRSMNTDSHSTQQHA